MKLYRHVSLVIALVLALGLVGSAGAQSSRFFPETGHSVGGRFLEYWQRNGGLPVFGYPLTGESQEDGRAVQYFERARFEYHPENRAPYDVLLGRLGAQVLLQYGVDWQTQPTSTGQVPGCRYFEATRHNVCNQQQGVGFLSYWSSHGLSLDTNSAVSYAESLALFGLPITEPYLYTNSSGDTVQTQWFERARFEWHPNNPRSFRVLLGRMGAEYLQNTGRGDQPGPPVFNQVKIALIAIGDGGRSGPQIGCGDSVVMVNVPIEPTTAPLTAATRRLLAINDQFYGQSGLYNALYQSDLQLDRATVAQGQATLYLTGSLLLGGVCDAPRIEAQLRETAKQFSTVSTVVVYVNGRLLEDVLSGR